MSNRSRPLTSWRHRPSGRHDFKVRIHFLDEEMISFFRILMMLSRWKRFIAAASRSLKTREVNSLVPAVCRDGIKFLQKLAPVSFIQYKAFIFNANQLFDQKL